MAVLNYAQAGVSTEAADRFVERIQNMTKATLSKKVKAAVGGYASLYELDKKRWLAASTDGVGTKLKLAFRLHDHRTVGIDLVAMSVNDLLCVGAEPLFFLDYFATGKLDGGVADQVIAGIVNGCKQAACALVGGETAEMPDFYHVGEYDLAGFAVGIVDPARALPTKTVQPGDALIGVASSGAHSNGFTLIRRLLDAHPETDTRVRELLKPTRIYVKALAPLLKARALKGLAHITGSGFLNVPRISDKVSYELELRPARERPEVFEWLRARSGLTLGELAATFNLGYGMIAVVDAKKAQSVVKRLRAAGEKAWVVGQVTRKRAGYPAEVVVRDGAVTATLRY